MANQNMAVILRVRIPGVDRDEQWGMFLSHVPAMLSKEKQKESEKFQERQNTRNRW